MKITIIKQPTGIVGGLSLDHYRPGRLYEVSAHLANYLVAEGFAIFDRREDMGDDMDDRSGGALDRRKHGKSDGV